MILVYIDDCISECVHLGDAICRLPSNIFDVMAGALQSKDPDRLYGARFEVDEAAAREMDRVAVDEAARDDHVEKVQSKLAQAQEYADSDRLYGVGGEHAPPDGVFSKIVTAGLPKDITANLVNGVVKCNVAIPIVVVGEER